MYNIKYAIVKQHQGHEIVWAYTSESALREDLRSYFGARHSEVTIRPVSESAVIALDSFRSPVFEEWRKNPTLFCFSLGSPVTARN